MNKLLICNCEDSTGNTTVRCCNLCGLSVDHVWKPQLTFEKFTLLKETPTAATDNTLTAGAAYEDKGAEEILKKHFDEDWPEDKGVRGTADDWEAFKESQPVFIKSMLAAMTEFASLKEQEAHNRAVQECLPLIERCEKTFGKIDEIFKLLLEAQPEELYSLVREIDIDIPLIQAMIKDEVEKLKK